MPPLDDRWSSFRITQQTATLGLALIGLGALRARGEFRDGWESPAWAVALLLALLLNLAHVAMERRSRSLAMEAPVRVGLAGTPGV